MTVPATTRRAGPFTGNGVTTSFPFTFKTFDTEDLAVTLTDADALESTLVLDSDYSVTLNGDQDASPGGSITYPISGAALAAGEKLTFIGAVDYDQVADLPTGGSFSPVVIENALDRATFQIQQLAEQAGRALTVAPAYGAIDNVLPAPESSKAIGWNEAGTALVNYAPADFATVVVNGTSYTDIFNGTGAQTAFALTANPGSVNALDIAISGVSQVNGVDFTVSGTTLTFTSAPPAATGNVCARYVAALPVGTVNAQDVVYNPAGTGAVATTGQAKLREWASPEDFGAAGDGSADDTAEVQAALTASRVVRCAPGKNYRVGALTMPDNTTLDLNGATLTAIGPILSSSAMVLTGNRCAILNGKIDSSNTNGAATVNADGAYYTILFENKAGLRVEGVEFTNYRYAVVMSTRTGQSCTDMLVQGCRFTGTIWPLSIPDSLPYCVFVGNTTNATNLTIGTFATNWGEAFLVSGARIIGNHMIGGQYGVALQRCSSVTIQGNTITEASRGVSVQQQCRNITISGNSFPDCHSTGISMAYGVRDVVISGNTISGPMSNDKTGIQAYYGCQDVVIANNALDTEFDQWDGGAHLEAATPSGGFGIRTGQMSKNIKIIGNQIRGFGCGVGVFSTIYPSVIPPGDANYQKAGAKNIEVKDNKIIFDYEVLVAAGYKGQNLASASYGVWVGKTGAWESSASGAWGLDDVSVEGNKAYDAQYSLVWQYTADTSGSPVAKTKLIARQNVAVSSIGTQADVYSGSITGVDVYSRDNSWPDSVYQDWTTFTPTASSLTVVNGTGGATLTGKYLRRGNTVWVNIYVTVTGTCTTASTLGSTSFTVAGITPAESGTCWAANATTGASYGTGVTNTTSTPVISPAWTATNSNIVVTAMFRV